MSAMCHITDQATRGRGNTNQTSCEHKKVRFRTSQPSFSRHKKAQTRHQSGVTLSLVSTELTQQQSSYSTMERKRSGSKSKALSLASGNTLYKTSLSKTQQSQQQKTGTRSKSSQSAGKSKSTPSGSGKSVSASSKQSNKGPRGISKERATPKKTTSKASVGERSETVPRRASKEKSANNAVTKEKSTVKKVAGGSDMRKKGKKKEGGITGNMGKPLVRVMMPVLCTLTLVILLVSMACSGGNQKRCFYGTLSEMKLPFTTESATQSNAQNVRSALLTALLFIAYVAVATFILAGVLYFRLTWCLYGYFAIALTSGLVMLVLMLIGIITSSFNLALDWFTAAFLTWNLALTAVLSFSILQAPKKLRQGTLIVFSAMVALTMITLLPIMTAMAVLAFLVFWDLFAVLAPCGPLGWIVKMMQQKGKDNKPAVQMPEVMIYSTMLYFTMSSSTKRKKLSQAEAEQEEGHSQEEEEGGGSLSDDGEEVSEDEDAGPVTPSMDKKKKRNVEDIHPQLGLGDFIFYSVLVGKSLTATSCVPTLICVILSVIFGLISTLMLLFVTRHALPALPISLTVALIVLAVMFFAGGPFSEALNERLIFI